MIATAHVIFDRNYFELQYDDWLAHRSKWRKCEIWFATALFLSGVVMMFVFRHQWLAGALFACAGIYEFAVAATYRRRWVNARIKSVRGGKSVDISFDDAAMTTTSAYGTARVLFSGFSAFTPASNGFFLTPETGISLYVPRASIQPPTMYPSIVDLLASSVDSKLNSQDRG